VIPALGQPVSTLSIEGQGILGNKEFGFPVGADTSHLLPGDRGTISSASANQGVQTLLPPLDAASTGNLSVVQAPATNRATFQINATLVSDSPEPVTSATRFQVSTEAQRVTGEEDLSPWTSDLLQNLTPLHVEVPFESLPTLLDPFEGLGGELTGLLRGMGATPWLLTLAAGVLTLEMSRRRRSGEELTVAAGCEGVTFTWFPEGPTLGEEP
jgi:hypothetical protein